MLVVPVEEQTMDKGEVPEVEEAHLGGQEDPTENAGQALEERLGGWVRSGVLLLKIPRDCK